MNKQFLLCIRSTGYPVALKPQKEYEVLPDEQAAQDGYVRIVDESGEDYLYPAIWFKRVELPHETRDAVMPISSTEWVPSPTASQKGKVVP